MANPHTITANSKLITLESLKVYNHTLCEKLGLTNDTFAYAYAKFEGTSKDPKTVKLALDDLYDLIAGINASNVAKATVTAADGVATVKIQDSTDADLATFKVASADDNLTVGVNAAGAVTVDAVAVSATAVDGTGTTEGHTEGKDELTLRSYVDNEIAKAKSSTDISFAGGAAEDAEDAVSFTKVGDSTTYAITATVGDTKTNLTFDAAAFIADSFLVDAALDADKKNLILTVKKADDTQTTITVPVSEILGNLKEGAGISITDNTIAIKLDANQDPYVVLTTSAAGLTASTNTADLTSTTSAEGKKTYAGTANTLSNSTNVAAVANELQEEIDTLAEKAKAAHSKVQADNESIAGTPDADAIKITATTDDTTGATTYTVGYATAVEGDITGLFIGD